MTKLIKDVAFALGVNVTKQTPGTDVRRLIERLKPLDCGKELVRIGGNADGGYLIPDDLDGMEYCFSPGVGPVVDFENHLADLNIKCFLADYSVDFLPVDRREFTFDKKFVGANNNDSYFTLESWRDKYLPTYASDLLLQMDIEGSEYEVILSAPVGLLDSFRIMVIEFHYLEKLFDPFVYRLYQACFEKILRNFYVLHLHPNNCCGSVKRGDMEVPRVMEFTFYNKRRVTATKYRKIFPHVLDRDNVPAREPLLLPNCWHE